MLRLTKGYRSNGLRRKEINILDRMARLFYDRLFLLNCRSRRGRRAETRRNEKEAISVSYRVMAKCDEIFLGNKASFTDPDKINEFFHDMFKDEEGKR